MIPTNDLDHCLRRALHDEPALDDDGFSARVLAALPEVTLSPMTAERGAAAMLLAMPLVIALLALAGAMPATLLETVCSALLLTGLAAAVWLATSGPASIDLRDARGSA